MMPSFALLPQRLRRIRKERGITLKTFADGAGVSESALSRWERGDRVPQPEQLALVANYLKMTPEQLLGDIGEGLIVRGEVEVGKDVTIGHYVTLDADADDAKIVIGDGCIIGNGVIMTGDIEIGNFCIIGAGAIIQPGTVVKTGRNVPAGAVVGKPVYEQG